MHDTFENLCVCISLSETEAAAAGGWGEGGGGGVSWKWVVGTSDQRCGVRENHAKRDVNGAEHTEH